MGRTHNVGGGGTTHFYHTTKTHLSLLARYNNNGFKNRSDLVFCCSSLKDRLCAGVAGIGGDVRRARTQYTRRRRERERESRTTTTKTTTPPKYY